MNSLYLGCALGRSATTGDCLFALIIGLGAGYALARFI